MRCAPERALTENIRASFRPDPLNPHLNRFKNDTPSSPMCENHGPQVCKNLGLFSLRIPYPINGNAPVLANHPIERDGVMFKLPSDWRRITVTHEATGESETLEFRMAAIGGSWIVPRPPGVSAWGGSTWSQAWRSAPAPCQSTGIFAASTNFALFFWLVPEGAGTCSR